MITTCSRHITLSKNFYLTFQATSRGLVTFKLGELTMCSFGDRNHSLTVGSIKVMRFHGIFGYLLLRSLNKMMVTT